MVDVADQSPSTSIFTRKPSARRRLSYGSQNSGTSSFRAGQASAGPRMNQLRIASSTMSIRSIESETEHSEIHSPMPRRHFLLQTESQQWLHTAPLSPSSSRPASPLSAVSTHPYDSVVTNQPSRPRREPTLSFSSLLENDNAAAIRLRRSSLSHDGLRPKDAEEDAEAKVGAGRRWIRWMHRNRMRDEVLVCSIAVAVWIKWCAGLGTYSGAQTPPMFGDYEAQRHWMEITSHLSIRQWYTYDLEYWGLDYPPLTAYHSWLCGKIGSIFNSSWFELDSSRGIETASSKAFMRATVLASDLFIYIPALIFFIRAWHVNRSRRSQAFAFLILLLQPSLILIDSGHFQYNSIMLGFTLFALCFFSRGRDELGAVFFVASLTFKQMSLYYAPAISCYLLSKCLTLGPTAGTRLFIRLGCVTVGSFVVAFLPFLPPFAPITGILDPISRIFPFARGLFEDKVANFWCASNVIFKWRSWFSQPTLIRMSAALTALGFLPSVATLLISGWKAMTMSMGSVQSSGDEKRKRESIIETPTLPILPWAMLSSSLSFFLFSFQVHEKTILVPLLPLNLLLSAAPQNSFTFEWCVLVNNVAVFSMWPLLKRDGLSIHYVALTLLWNYVIGYNPLRISDSRKPFKYITLLVYAAMIVLHAAELALAPPKRFPDIYPVLNVLLSTPVFVITWLWSIKRCVEVSWGTSKMGFRPKASKQE